MSNFIVYAFKIFQQNAIIFNGSPTMRLLKIWLFSRKLAIFAIYDDVSKNGYHFERYFTIILFLLSTKVCLPSFMAIAFVVWEIFTSQRPKKPTIYRLKT